MKLTEAATQAYKEALAYLHEAIGAEKCRSCGCFHNLVKALEEAVQETPGLEDLRKLTAAAKQCLLAWRYDCLGCEVCIPPLVLNALGQALGAAFADLEVCPAEKVVARQGWPPLPGAYQVLRYQAPVAVCTLTSEDLAAAVGREAGEEISLVGMLHTENLGIERLIQNVLANPHLRFVIVCGLDSRQAVGHYPGQSLAALAQHGLDDRRRIIDARGRRPLLNNLSPADVSHFQEVIEVIDLIGELNAQKVLSEAGRCAARNPGPADPYPLHHIVTPIFGYLPSRLVTDPAGYFVIYVDRGRERLSLEHYLNDGVLDAVIEGGNAAELYTPAIDRGLISRLDHAAYLGRELARAEESLHSGKPFVQDAAPQVAALLTLASHTCGPACREAEA